MKTFKYKTNVSIVSHIDIGDTVRTNGFRYKLDGKDWLVEDVKIWANCESGVMIKINGYDSYIDSGWLTKVEKK